LKVLTTITHQFPGEEEAVIPEFHDYHIIWCFWDNDILLHDMLRLIKTISLEVPTM
jgi:hypothetical protein